MWHCVPKFTTDAVFPSFFLLLERPSPLHVLPLVSQSHFLRNLNIAARLEDLVATGQASGSLTDEEIGVLIENAVKLVSTDAQTGGMGALFKVMCITSKELKEKEMIPFNIHDAVMEAEDQAAKAKRDEYEKGKTTKVQVEAEIPSSANAATSTRRTSPSSTSTPIPTSSTPTPSSTSSDSTPTATATAASTPPTPTPSPTSMPSSSSSFTTTSGGSLADRIAARRAAARQAAEELAKSRREKGE